MDFVIYSLLKLLQFFPCTLTYIPSVPNTKLALIQFLPIFASFSCIRCVSK
jgi:hypothetical protein